MRVYFSITEWERDFSVKTRNQKEQFNWREGGKYQQNNDKNLITFFFLNSSCNPVNYNSEN